MLMGLICPKCDLIYAAFTWWEFSSNTHAFIFELTIYSHVSHEYSNTVLIYGNCEYLKM